MPKKAVENMESPQNISGKQSELFLLSRSDYGIGDEKDVDWNRKVMIRSYE